MAPPPFMPPVNRAPGMRSLPGMAHIQQVLMFSVRKFTPCFSPCLLPSCIVCSVFCGLVGCMGSSGALQTTKNAYIALENP